MSEYWREVLRGFVPRDDYWFIPITAIFGVFCAITIVIIAVAVWIRFVIWAIDRLTWWAS
jgi:hypothetical protein